MRYGMILVFLALAGCAGAAVPIGAVLGVEVASIVVFGRGLGDIGVSAFSGRDCSIVRLDRGLTYCAERYSVQREAHCTRTLATVDCWQVPPPNRAEVADTPAATPAQERYRAAPWPKSLTANW